MSQTFKLARTGEPVVPASGEDLGVALAEFAGAKEAAARANPEALVMYWGGTVAQILYLAADAFDQGASASIGHNRADRYQERARELRTKAEAIEAEARGQRDEIEGARMKAAFGDGFKFETSDVSRYSFASRAAFLVGQHFRARSLPMPESVKAIRGDREASDYIEADGRRFAVRYPGGKISDATVSPVAATA